MPQRPVHSPIYNDFDSIIAMERPTTPRYVVANVGVWNFSKGALVQAHSPPQDSASFDHTSPPRPRTSSGMFGRIRNHSFSRPRTSDGAKQSARDTATPRPSHLKHSHTFSDFANIGVAIGSPTVAHQPSQERPKPKRWKTIGSLFSPKRRVEDVSTSSEIKAESQPEQLAKSSSWPVRSTSLHLRSRSRNLSKSLRFPRPSQPDEKEVEELKKLTRSAPASLHRTASVRRKGSQRRRPRGETQPVIDISIPRVDGFERFSVMFSELLHDPLLTGIEPPLPTPSLLERRKKEADLLPLLDVKTGQKDAASERPSRPRAQTETATLRHKPVGTASLKRAQSATRNVERTPSVRSSRSTRSNRSNRSNRSLGKSPTYSLFPRTAENTPPVPAASTFGGTPRPSTSSGRPNVAPSSTPRFGTSPAKNQTVWLQTDDSSIVLQSSPLSTAPVDTAPADTQESISLDDQATSAALNMCLREPSAQPLVFPPSPALSISKDVTFNELETALPSPSFYSARSSGDPHGLHNFSFHTHSRSRSTSDLPNLHHGPAYEVYLTPPLHTADFPAPLFAQKSTISDQSVTGPAQDLTTSSPSLLPSTRFLPAPDPLSRVPSLNHSLYDYDAPHSPLVAVARTVSVCYKHEGGRAQPHLLVRAPGTRNLRDKAKAAASTAIGEKDEDEDEEFRGRASFQESVVRVRSPCLVRADDDYDDDVGGERMSEEEREWARRRSVWGLLEEGSEAMVV